jgi:dienelactone hydrolase
MREIVKWVLCAVTAVSAAAADPPTTFKLEGERWTLREGRTTLEGILVKPEGDGPFPGILVSHGLGGNAEGFGLPKARELVKMGFVCIGPNYAHARRDGALVGERKDFGASDENLRRASRCLDLLEGLPYVDRTRLAAYGHSMGGFLTIGLAAKETARVKAAAITAGGIAPVEGVPAPSVARAEKIRAPFLIFHGDADQVVPAERSASLKQVLDRNQVPNERRVYPGVGHGVDREKSTEVFAAMKAWFQKHGVLK